MGAWDVISCPLGSKMLPSHGHPGTRHTEITVEKGWGKRVRKRWDKYITRSSTKRPLHHIRPDHANTACI